ncbi:5-formyltetrahydrofolate cyclo-ligase [Hyphococcus sp.]|uniref:5-formyltetrahydrofolate cyclo-ligase n=1 Tax=Hyphococcus sp. TaxID=2038636 RepID=UPI00375022AC
MTSTTITLACAAETLSLDDPGEQAQPSRQCAYSVPHDFDLRKWRTAERRRLISERLNLTQSRRVKFTQAIVQYLDRLLGGANGQTISFYWPFKGEPDLRELMTRLSQRNNTIALPLVVERNQPLVFKSWRPGEPLDRGVWKIPVPRDGKIVQPDIILAPVVGFDPCGFRLGYGGGYFDRTLAAMQHRPIKYGIAYNISNIPTIHPQTYDIPMSAVVTEGGVIWPQLQGVGTAANTNLSRVNTTPDAAVIQ